MTAARVATIRARLEAALQPTALVVRDDSARHAGHAGARDGAGHFIVDIESEKFQGLDRLRRHRLVYAALAGMMPADIHALSIDAKTPGEREPADSQLPEGKDD